MIAKRNINHSFVVMQYYLYDEIYNEKLLRLNGIKIKELKSLEKKLMNKM